MRRFRYICGGEDGSRVVGSAGAGEGSREPVRSGEADAAAAATEGRETLGGGEPLTSWSRPASDIGFGLICWASRFTVGAFFWN
jgi:hypothetical protein